MDFLNKQTLNVDFIQTFFLDANRVNNNSTADITYVELYFKTKPDLQQQPSFAGTTSVTVFLTEMQDGRPVINAISSKRLVTKDYNQISVSSDAKAVTRFEFSSPITLATGREYGVAIVFGAPGYELWMAKAGDRVVGTNDPSPGGSLDHKGDLFVRNNVEQIIGDKSFDNIFTKRTSLDIKFSIAVAKYDVSNTVNVNLVNDDYEFFTVSNINGSFIEGEQCYKYAADGAGTVSTTINSAAVVGVGTSFTTSFAAGDYIVIKDASVPIGNTFIGQVHSVTNNTNLTLVIPAPKTLSAAKYVDTIIARLVTRNLINNKLYLNESTANTSVQFAAASQLIAVSSGANCTISSVDNIPIYEFMYASDPDLKNRGSILGNHYLTEGVTIGSAVSMKMRDTNFRGKKTAILLSKSTEMLNVGTLYDSDATNTDPKSFRLNTTLSTTGTADTDYEAPQLDIDDAYLGISSFAINNLLTNEHTDYGSATAKHISTKMTLNAGDSAEDVRVIYNAFKPYGTEITSYARIISQSDPAQFSDKHWTKLEMISGQNEFSMPDNKNDIRVYEYQFPKYPDTLLTLAGTASIVGSNNIVTGSNTAFGADLSIGDIIKIYSPTDPDIYGIFVVDTVTNATSIILTGIVSDVNLQRTGLKIDTLVTPHTGWLNPDNFNIVRYITPNGEVHDGWRSIAIKTVFTSTSVTNETPFVTKSSVIGVSS